MGLGQLPLLAGVLLAERVGVALGSSVARVQFVRVRRCERLLERRERRLLVAAVGLARVGEGGRVRRFEALLEGGRRGLVLVPPRLDSARVIRRKVRGLALARRELFRMAVAELRDRGLVLVARRLQRARVRGGGGGDGLTVLRARGRERLLVGGLRLCDEAVVLLEEALDLARVRLRRRGQDRLVAGLELLLFQAVRRRRRGQLLAVRELLVLQRELVMMARVILGADRGDHGERTQGDGASPQHAATRQPPTTRALQSHETRGEINMRHLVASTCDSRSRPSRRESRLRVVRRVVVGVVGLSPHRGIAAGGLSRRAAEP